METSNTEEDIEVSDHDLILHLKDQIDGLTSAVESRDSQLAIHEKIMAQNAVLRHIFYGLIFSIIMMAGLVVVGWLTKQEAVERELAFFERIILVLIGIVGGAVSSFFDVRDLKLASSRDKGDRS